jgi:hypothetical protein
MTRAKDSLTNGGNMNREVFSPAKVDLEVFSPANLDREGFSPENVDREAFSSENVGHEICSPGNVGCDGFSPENVGRDVFLLENVGDEIFPPGNVCRAVFSPETVSHEGFLPVNVGHDAFFPWNSDSELLPLVVYQASTYDMQTVRDQGLQAFTKPSVVYTDSSILQLQPETDISTTSVNNSTPLRADFIDNVFHDTNRRSYPPGSKNSRPGARNITPNKKRIACPTCHRSFLRWHELKYVQGIKSLSLFKKR